MFARRSFSLIFFLGQLVWGQPARDTVNRIFGGRWRTACLKRAGAVPAGRGAGWVRAPALGGDAGSGGLKKLRRRGHPIPP